jgi:hypothetical protein
VAVHAKSFYQRPRRVKRELVLAIDPSLYPEIKGQTDTEMLFYLALTRGLDDDSTGAVARAIGPVERSRSNQA